MWKDCKISLLESENNVKSEPSRKYVLLDSLYELGFYIKVGHRKGT